MAYERWWYWCRKCKKWATVIVAQTSTSMSINTAVPIKCDFCGADMMLKELPEEDDEE